MIKRIKEQNYLSIVVVLSHDSINISKFLFDINRFCKENFVDYELILVDNKTSKNILSQALEEATQSKLQTHLVTLPYKVNKEQAVIAGVDAAVGDYVFEFEDANIDHPANDLWRMYESCLAGHDIVLLRTNYKTGYLEKFFYKLLANYSYKNLILYPSKINLVSRRAINRINSINRIIYYRKYSYCSLGLKYVYIEPKSNTPIQPRKLNWKEIDFALDLLIIFTTLGKRVTILFSLLFAILSILSAIYTITTYLTINVMHGWTTLMLFISVSFTGVFLCFSIALKYLSLLFATQLQNEALISNKEKIQLL